MKSQRSKQSGFTLVEIAIVLVIIGLLLGGVLKGQEMITSSKAKSLVADKNAILSAFNGYQDRYRALPGDDDQAAVRFTAAQCGGTACQVGNGNGVINPQAATAGTGTYNPLQPAPLVAGATNENAKFWQHLRAANFIKSEGGVFSAYPVNATAGVIGVTPTSAYGGQAPASLYFMTGNVPGNVATALDAANDDGFTNLGGWRAVANTAANANAGALYVNGTTYAMSSPLY